MSPVTTRAKFYVQTVKFWGDPNDENTARTYELIAVYDDGTAENRRFNKASPYGKLEIKVDNPAARLKVHSQYYLDFTEAE